MRRWTKTVAPLFALATSERPLAIGALAALALVEFFYMLGTIVFRTPYFYHGLQVSAICFVSLFVLFLQASLFLILFLFLVHSFLQGGNVLRDASLPTHWANATSAGGDGDWVIAQMSIRSMWGNAPQTAVAQPVELQFWTSPLVVLAPLWAFVLWGT